MTNEMNAARPVGGEALREAFEECQPDPASNIACAIMCLPWARGGDEDEHCDRYGQIQEIAFPIIATALAAHPTMPPLLAKPLNSTDVKADAETYLERAVSAVNALSDIHQQALFIGWVESTTGKKVDLDALAALASHPTTGQETVATPRDGGVREALDQVDRTLWEEGCTTAHPAYKALQVIRAALSAPGSAGPGDRVRILAFDGSPGGEIGTVCNVTYGIALDGPDGPKHPMVSDFLSVERDGFELLATPSPAQEPGTGDTGEIVAAFREAQEARDDAGFVGTVADCIRFFATPATTAETRGPAEGAR